jgi:glycosyltransferase involved in cell wall biosynthesis
MSDALNELLAQIGMPNATKPVILATAQQQAPVPTTPAPVATPDSALLEKKRGRLCLNMIVKNESKIITRLLDSVKSIIDAFCICDTGSTDDTVSIIRKWAEDAGIPGEVYTEPFQNFGYNRSHSLDRAAAWGEYALLLDADMKLVITPEFDKSALKDNGYSIIQKNGTLDYYNTRLVRTGVGVKCVGPTHEYYDFPGGGGGTKLSTLWINDIGDGGCKSDKYVRDIRLLETALEADPKNGRYHFYLAQSYNHSGNKEKAFEFYKKRVELGGWVEEVFYAAMEAGNMAKELGKDGDAVFWWMEAYNRHPRRSESLYELSKYYREKGKNHTSQIFTDLGKSIPYPKDDVLFIKKACYEYLFDYEASINCYYTKRPVDHYDYLELLGREYNKDNVLSNYKFYVKKLKDLTDVKKVDFCGKAVKTIMGREDEFVSSSPCIIPCADGYLLNVRYVNYTIRPDGSYAFKHNDGKITTLNLLQWLNRDFRVLKSQWIDKVQNETLRYQGVEDVKIFAHCDSILFCGTVENPANGNVAVGHGALDLKSDRLTSTAWESPSGRRCEKNWCYFHTAAGDLRMIYDWSPLTIAEPGDVNLNILSRDSEVPRIFKDLRGSSNGCLVGDEIWFLTHLVQYCTPRHYYHMIVVLDAKTLKVKRHSILFKFNGDCIEYALGFLVERDRVIFSYSTMDRTSTVLTLPRSVMESELFPHGAV